MIRFLHDCRRCRFLGHTANQDHPQIDWYACPSSAIGTTSIIGRFSDEGSDYFSMPLDLILSTTDGTPTMIDARFWARSLKETP